MKGQKNKKKETKGQTESLVHTQPGFRCLENLRAHFGKFVGKVTSKSQDLRLFLDRKDVGTVVHSGPGPEKCNEEHQHMHISCSSDHRHLPPALRNKLKQNTAVEGNASPLLVQAAEKNKSLIGSWPEKANQKNLNSAHLAISYLAQKGDPK